MRKATVRKYNLGAQLKRKKRSTAVEYPLTSVLLLHLVKVKTLYNLMVLQLMILIPIVAYSRSNSKVKSKRRRSKLFRLSRV